MKINENIQYLEGRWSANSLIKHIELSDYKTLENAVESKGELLDQFEKNFGFSRSMENIDSNYAFNAGLYDALKEDTIKDISDTQLKTDAYNVQTLLTLIVEIENSFKDDKLIEDTELDIPNED
jgi:hypothetical protein